MLTVAVHPEGIVLAVCFCYALSGLSLACHSKHQPLCECKPSMPEACGSAACPNRPVWPAASVQCWPAMQGHFLQLSGRDDALSRSLNSDYLAQLYINPDTKCMDQSFAAVVQRDEDLPDEAKSMLVFKRGSVPRRITHTSDSDMHACMGRTSLCSMSASLCYMQPMPVCPCAALTSSAGASCAFPRTDCCSRPLHAQRKLSHVCTGLLLTCAHAPAGTVRLASGAACWCPSWTICSILQSRAFSPMRPVSSPWPGSACSARPTAPSRRAGTSCRLLGCHKAKTSPPRPLRTADSSRVSHRRDLPGCEFCIVTGSAWFCLGMRQRAHERCMAGQNFSAGGLLSK